METPDISEFKCNFAKMQKGTVMRVYFNDYPFFCIKDKDGTCRIQRDEYNPAPYSSFITFFKPKMECVHCGEYIEYASIHDGAAIKCELCGAVMKISIEKVVNPDNFEDPMNHMHIQ